MNILKKLLIESKGYKKDFAIEITMRIGCRVSCAYCPQNTLSAEYTKRSNVIELKMDVFKTCINKIPPYVHIVFGGMSEPFLNPECAEMILYASKKGRKIGVATTLVGMKLSDIDSIKNVVFEFFYLHLPSAERLEKIEMNAEYLNILEEISKSNIKTCYISHGKKLPSQILPYLKDKRIILPPTITRSGNIEINGRLRPKKSIGPISCKRNFRWNVLLPNADVLLCSNDYAMKHVLGNLITSDYDSLFRGTEYLKVKMGLKDDSIDILCRFCDTFSYHTNLLTKIFYPTYQYLRRLKHSLYSAITGKQVFYP